MLKKKVIIFDFDGTLYSGDNIFSLIPDFIDKNKRKFLPRLSDEQYSIIVKENPSWVTVFTGADIVDHIYAFEQKYPSFDISINDYRKWELNVIEPVIINQEQTIDIIFLKNLCSKYPVYIVSNSDIIHVRHYMKQLNINPDWFRSIISNQFIIEDRTKKHYYQEILSKEKCPPQNAYVFGDSFNHDIEPALQLGMNAFHVTNALTIPEIVTKMIK